MPDQTPPSDSVARSAAGAAARGAGLVAVALLIGVLLMRSTVEDTRAIADDAATTSTLDPAVTTTSTPPSTTVAETTTTSTTVAETTTTSTTVPSPAELTLVVLNGGTGVTGAAAAINDQLAPLGFTTLTPTNVNPGTVFDTSTIYHGVGLEPVAADLVAELGWEGTIIEPLPETPPAPAAEVADADLIVVLGVDNAS